MQNNKNENHTLSNNQLVIVKFEAKISRKCKVFIYLLIIWWYNGGGVSTNKGEANSAIKLQNYG